MWLIDVKVAVLSFLKKVISDLKRLKMHFISPIYIYKVQLCWEGHKNSRNIPHGFDIYLLNVKTMRTIAQFFVAFSENLNFTMWQWLSMWCERGNNLKSQTNLVSMKKGYMRALRLFAWEHLREAIHSSLFIAKFCGVLCFI